EIKLHIQNMEDEINIQHDTINEEINNPSCTQETDSVTESQLIKATSYFNGVYEINPSMANSMTACLSDYLDDLEESKDHCLSRITIIFNDQSFTDFLCRIQQIDRISDITETFFNFKRSLNNNYDSDSGYYS
ncbi:hypothetical protein, partial [Salmonella sp. s51228]|uniref:hypothetical protein n=1 Tax=Salmonella sp. s51228 TaxID=3159652 RepID=UPI0039814245